VLVSPSRLPKWQCLSWQCLSWQCLSWQYLLVPASPSVVPHGQHFSPLQAYGVGVALSAVERFPKLARRWRRRGLSRSLDTDGVVRILATATHLGQHCLSGKGCATRPPIPLPIQLPLAFIPPSQKPHHPQPNPYCANPEAPSLPCEHRPFFGTPSTYSSTTYSLAVLLVPELSRPDSCPTKYTVWASRHRLRITLLLIIGSLCFPHCRRVPRLI
jgi:hypothetical protein